MRVGMATLGCKVNQVETESIKEQLIVRGFEIVDFAEEADIYIVNTCTVTHISDRKSRAMLRRARRRNPAAVVIAVGCLTRVDDEQLSGMKDVDLVIKDKEQVPDWVEIIAANSKGQSIPKIVPELSGCSTLKPVVYRQKHNRTRAFIKIEDGCDAFCTYCIVPYARGPVCSKKAEDVVIEVKNLINLGYREIVLTGIHTGAYGRDIPPWDLAGLLTKIIHDVAGDYRIRLSSLEPLEVSDSLIELMQASTKICRHLHIPLQSGSDRILTLMNRKYRRDYYRFLATSLADRLPGIAVTTDVMVGFPGESEKDFADTCNLLQELPVSSMHVFKYSLRRGTLAAVYPEQVGEEVKQKRSRILIELGKRKEKEFMQSQAGKELVVLVERPSPSGGSWALSDNYLQLDIPGVRHLQGELTKVSVKSPGCGEYLSSSKGENRI